MVKHGFYQIFDIIRCFNFILILRQVYGRYLDLPKIEPLHQSHKRIFSIPHHHIFLPLDQLVVGGCDGGFLESAVHVFD